MTETDKVFEIKENTRRLRLLSRAARLAVWKWLKMKREEKK